MASYCREIVEAGEAGTCLTYFWAGGSRVPYMDPFGVGKDMWGVVGAGVAHVRFVEASV